MCNILQVVHFYGKNLDLIQFAIDDETNLSPTQIPLNSNFRRTLVKKSESGLNSSELTCDIVKLLSFNRNRQCKLFKMF